MVQKFLGSKISEPSSECARCVHIMFGGQIFKKVSVQAILSTPACLVWYWNGMVKKLEGGGKLIAKKIKFFFCARIVLLARAKFLRQPLITFKTFVFDRFSRLFPDCSRLRKMGLPPPLMQF